MVAASNWASACASRARRRATSVSGASASSACTVSPPARAAAGSASARSRGRQPLPHPFAQLLVASRPNVTSISSGSVATALGDVAGGERGDRERLAGARTGLEHGGAGGQRTADVERGGRENGVSSAYHVLRLQQRRPEAAARARRTGWARRPAAPPRRRAPTRARPAPRPARATASARSRARAVRPRPAASASASPASRSAAPDPGVVVAGDRGQRQRRAQPRRRAAPPARRAPPGAASGGDRPDDRPGDAEPLAPPDRDRRHGSSVAAVSATSRTHARSRCFGASREYSTRSSGVPVQAADRADHAGAVGQRDVDVLVGWPRPPGTRRPPPPAARRRRARRRAARRPARPAAASPRRHSACRQWSRSRPASRSREQPVADRPRGEPVRLHRQRVGGSPRPRAYIDKPDPLA